MHACIQVVCAAFLGLTVFAPPATPQAFLQLYGQPYFEGAMALSVTDAAHVGQPVWLAFGTNPLPRDAPGFTSYGPLYIGNFQNLIFVGFIPTSGRLDVDFQMPAFIAAAAGVPYAVQAFVANQLSNPATLPFDLPYFEPAAMVSTSHPVPTQSASFGDYLGTGDLNDDGFLDIAVGAWFEDTSGVDRSGAAYVLWGPDYSAFTQLLPAIPHVLGFFGTVVLVGDFTADHVDDLLIGEGSAYPTLLNAPGWLHIYKGGSNFGVTPILDLPSPGAGSVYDVWGRGAVLGDLNGDGNSDLAIPLFHAGVSGKPQAGRIQVLWGPTYSAGMQILNPTPSTQDFFGSSLDIGDVNGDGIDDLVEGSARTDVGGIVNVGRVHVFLGPALALSQTIEYPHPPIALAGFGEMICVEDLDGDGLSEIVCADYKEHAFIFWAGNPSDVTQVSKPPSQDTNPFGETLFALHIEAGDMNGDNVGDIVLSDPGDGHLNCTINSSGMLYVALGPYYQTFHSVVDSSAQCGDFFGLDVAVLELDGQPGRELVVGSTTADIGAVLNAGRITTIHH